MNSSRSFTWAILSLGDIWNPKSISVSQGLNWLQGQDERVYEILFLQALWSLSLCLGEIRTPWAGGWGPQGPAWAGPLHLPLSEVQSLRLTQVPSALPAHIPQPQTLSPAVSLTPPQLLNGYPWRKSHWLPTQSHSSFSSHLSTCHEWHVFHLQSRIFDVITFRRISLYYFCCIILMYYFSVHVHLTAPFCSLTVPSVFPSEVWGCLWHLERQFSLVWCISQTTLWWWCQQTTAKSQCSHWYPTHGAGWAGSQVFSLLCFSWRDPGRGSRGCLGVFS